MGLTMQVLRRWVREFAAGVDAGNAIRHGLPVRADALQDGSVRDVAARAGYDAGSERPACPARPTPWSVRRPPAPRRCRRIPTTRGRA
jgi:hypothetical protein